jgi:hypothetical protein
VAGRRSEDRGGPTLLFGDGEGAPAPGEHSLERGFDGNRRDEDYALTDHENGTEAQSSKEAAVIPLFPWLADRMKRYFHERKAPKQKETTEERSSRVTAQATVVVATFAIVAALIAGSQAVIGNRTLDEMRAEQRPVIWTGSDLGAPNFL